MDRLKIRCVLLNLCTRNKIEFLLFRNKDQKKKQHICHIPGCNKVYGKTSHLRAHLRFVRHMSRTHYVRFSLHFLSTSLFTDLTSCTDGTVGSDRLCATGCSVGSASPGLMSCRDINAPTLVRFLSPSLSRRAEESLSGCASSVTLK